MTPSHRLIMGGFDMTFRFSAFFTTAVIVCSSSALAQSKEPLTSHLSEDGRTLSYTPCESEEWGECISHSLHCRGDGGFGDGLAMVITGAAAPAGPDVRKMAKDLIDKPLGESAVPFIVGSKTIDLPVAAVTISNNEMVGDWDLSIHFSSEGDVLDRLDGSTDKVDADVGGEMISLASSKRDAENLARLKTACAR